MVSNVVPWREHWLQSSSGSKVEKYNDQHKGYVVTSTNVCPV